jgi:hypothetical protein
MDSIKERIAKLLAMAASGNEHEAALAMGMAQTLMDKHNLSMAELTVEGITEEAVIKDGEALFLAGRISSWKEILAGHLVTANACRLIKYTHQGRKLGGNRGSSLHIYGRPSDIAIVRFMLAYAVTQLTRLAPKGMGKIYSNSWYLGAVRGINEKLEASKKEVYKAASQYALVKLDNRAKAVDLFVEAAIPKLRKAPQIVSNIHSGAYNQGYQQGRNMDLNEKSRLKTASTIGVK